MKIKAVRVREVGLFTKPVALNGFSGELDVLAGDNEFGKSTIFRALRTVFLEKHTTAGKVVRELTPRSGGAPLIEADFEQGGQEWRITKQFGRLKKAELFCLSGGDTVLRGPDAEDRLAEIIGVDGVALPGRFNLLWVAQKHGFGRPDLDNDPFSNKHKDRGERPVILRAIETEVSAVAGGPLARGVRGRVKEALDALVTSRGAKKGGPLDLALVERAKVEEQLSDALEVSERTAAWMSELGAARDRENALNAAGRNEEMEARASQMRLKVSDALKAGHQLNAAKAERAAALEKLAGARGALKVFRADLEELAGHDERARAGAKSSEQFAREFAKADGEFGKAKKHLAGLQEELVRLGDLVVARGLFDRRQHHEKNLADRTGVLGVARSLEKSITKISAELRGNPVSSAVMEELSLLEREVRVGEGLLAAGAPTVDIALVEGGKGRLSVDGATVNSDSDYVVSKPMSIEVDGVGTISVAPGETAGRADQEKQLAEQRASLAELLNTVGAVDLKSARVAFKDRSTREGVMREAKAKLEAVAGGGLAELEDEVLQLSNELSDGAGEAGDGPPPSDELNAKIVEVRAQISKADEVAQQLAGVRADLSGKAHTLKAEAAAREQRLGVLIEKLGEPGARVSLRAKFSGEVAVLNEAALNAERAFEALPQPPDLTAIEALKAQVVEAERALKTQSREALEVRAVISRLEGQIQVSDDSGAGVRVAQVRGELERANAHVEGYERDVSALKLLQRELENAGDVAKAQIAAPVMKRLIPYLSLLFSGAKVSIGEGLRIEGLERGEVVEDLNSLSDGTLEQLAIVVRLAYARLLADTGSAVPLFLDDPLAYSDDLRLERVFEALRLGAKSHQVIVFTCRGNAFSNLGGNSLQICDWEDAS